MTRLLLFAAIAALLAPSALAQTCTRTWAAPVDGSWTVAANWTPAEVPDAGDVACITAAGTYTVTVGAFDSEAAGTLVLGGTSGTQTLMLLSPFSVTDAAIRPNGLLTAFGTGGAQQGLYATGTVTLQGVVEQGSGTSFLSTGGTLDIAPGGVLRLSGSGSAGNTAGLFRVRGTIEGVGCAAPNTGDCQVRAPIEVLGGTLRATSGVLSLSAGGTMNGATLDAGPTGFLSLSTQATTLTNQYTIEGTIGGDPQGSVQWFRVRVAAGPAGATLAMGGTGFQLVGSTGPGTTYLTSAGGSFTNTGLLTKPASGSNFAGLLNVVVRNRGVIEIPSSLALYVGSRLINEPGGVVRATGTGSLAGDGRGTGRFENAGLFVLDAPGASFGFGAGGFGNNSGLFSRPGSEIRVLRGTLDLVGPASRNLPVGATLTGAGSVVFPGTFQPEGTVSPGTESQPLARLAHGQFYYPSQVAGSPRLVIDVDAGGRSDTLDVSAFGSGGSTSIAILAGALVVRVRPGYVPAVGDAFTILTALRPVTGQFAQIAVLGAPDGITFLTELSADQTSVLLRAVAVAPGGPITVATTAPVGGGVRPIFLTGPGAGGVSAGRLECTDCLDAAAFGTIQAQIVGAGALREARFDLTNPRAFGFYDLVLTSPGLDDERVPVTVRPYLSFVFQNGGINRGMRIRPAGNGYNWSWIQMRNRTNSPEPSYPFQRIRRPLPENTGLAIATGNPFSGVATVLYESDTAVDPFEEPLVFARIPAGQDVALNPGLRIDPEAILFPEQTPTGPDDPRLPFGEALPLYAYGPFHVSFARSTAVLEAALRTANSAPLADYLAAVDAADSGAVTEAVRLAVQYPSQGYFTVARGLLGRVIDELQPTAPAPAGLAAAAAAAFDAAMKDRADALQQEMVDAVDAIATAPVGVRNLYEAEVAVLIPELSQPRTIARGSRALRGNTAADVCADYTGSSGNAGGGVGLENVYDLPELNGGTSATGAGAVGGTKVCPPSSGDADPNDKQADTNLRCEFGTVIVSGEPQTRCVRYFVPLARAADPIGYTIQFENLAIATEPAEFITITDELDPSLNPAFLEVVGTSSDSTFSYSVSGQTVTFRFVGINLPPNVTAPEGEGYVRFRVRPQPGLPDGTEIRNDASIVFSFNPPIVTPEVLHEIRETADLTAVLDGPDFVDAGTPALFTAVLAHLGGDDVEEATLTLSAPGATISGATPSTGTCVGAGPVVCTFPALMEGDAPTVAFLVTSPSVSTVVVGAEAAGATFDAFAPNDADAISLEFTVVDNEFGPNDLRELTLASPRPNPARGAVALRWGLPAAGRADVRVYDLLGREVARLVDGAPTSAGWHETRWDAAVASGVYVVRLMAGDEVRTRRLVVVR